MKLLEYEAKIILEASQLPVPKHTIISPTDTLDHISLPIVLKSQVPVGGRGKLGGVVIVENKAQLQQMTKNLFALPIKGYTPRVLLAEEKLIIDNEHYVSLLIDEASATIRLVAHKKGGIEVETNDPAAFLNIPLSTDSLATAAQQLADYLGYSTESLRPLLNDLLRAFVENDATLIEINPLIRTADNMFICGDCKMELDDAASFRHQDWSFQEKTTDANFITLNQNGNVATIANGAGLAMATVDAVTAKGLTPANFLDIGGGATAQSILVAFQKINEFSYVQAIVINIFAGITQCDQVAKAVIEAKKHLPTLPPLYIRLAGTRFEEAVTMLEAENITTLANLEACLDAAKEYIND